MYQEQSTNREWNSERADNDNKSNQCNPNNSAYWKARGHDERPDDWEEKIDTKLPRENEDNRANQLNPNNPRYLWSRGELDSCTSGVPFSSSQDEFQLEINKELNTSGLQTDEDKVCNMVEDQKGNNQNLKGVIK